MDKSVGICYNGQKEGDIMLATLIPLFDENMGVKAYSLFTQKKNMYLDPSILGSGQYDGAANVEGLEIIRSMGVDTIAEDQAIFVPVGNISMFSDIDSQCDVPHDRLVLLLDNSILPEEIYVKRLKELKESGYKLAMRKLEVAKFEEYREILRLVDYIFLNHKKIDITKARIYFQKVYPISSCVPAI